jgi:hypothetical protein
MKNLVFFLIAITSFSNNLFAQDMKSVYESFKADSVKFRSLQNKKALTSQFLAYELGYGFDGPTSKKIIQFNLIKKRSSCVWIMKDSLNKVKLIASVSQNGSEDWGTHITVLHFDENEKLKFMRLDYNTDASNGKAFLTQNWTTDKDAHPCDYYFIDGKIIGNGIDCNVDDIVSEFNGGTIAINSAFVKPNISEILKKSFGIK